MAVFPALAGVADKKSMIASLWRRSKKEKARLVEKSVLEMLFFILPWRAGSFSNS